MFMAGTTYRSERTHQFWPWYSTTNAAIDDSPTGEVWFDAGFTSCLADCVCGKSEFRG